MNNTQELQYNLQDIAIVMQELKDHIKSERKFIVQMLHIFQGVTDFRKEGRVKYQLENILCICLLIAMWGQFTSFLNASLFIQIKADYFVKLKLLDKKQIPSPETIIRIFMYLDANELRDVILNRIKKLITKIVAYVPKRKTDGVRLPSGDGKHSTGQI